MKLKLFIIIVIVGAASSCKDIFEENIENKTISIKSPMDNAISNSYSQLFWWEALDGATKYHLEIVSPTFGNVQDILLDTIVTETKFTYNLNPGNYQWRIQAQNENYQTDYQKYSLTIQSSSLENQTVARIGPINDKFYKDSVVRFSWQYLYGATKYEIQLDNINSNYTNPILTDSTENLEYNYEFQEEGDYIWRVRAKNNSGEKTPWTSSWTSGYYSTLPDAPNLKSPQNNEAKTSSDISFSWYPVNRAKYYKLYIYEEGSSTPEIIEVYGTTKQKTFTNVSYVAWEVTSVDKAGNESEPSTQWDFTIE